MDGPTAVVRAEVHYGDPPHQESRDLWIIRLAEDGRCRWFEVAVLARAGLLRSRRPGLMVAGAGWLKSLLCANYRDQRHDHR